MKKNIILILFFLITLSFISCKKEESYSLIRNYYSDSYVTKKGAELRTASPMDDNLRDENDEPLKSAYYAIIVCQITVMEDSIIQYGHCWSKTNPEPYIIPTDTSNYSKFKPEKNTQLEQFQSRIINLMPEEVFYVRSYVITNKGDTGYNKQIFCDTTLVPINEWFITDYVGTIPFEGAATFTMKGFHKNYECGYLAGGNNGLACLDDFWEYDPIEEAWQQIGHIHDDMTDAVGFAITYYDQNIQANRTKAYLGSGRNSNGTEIYDDWCEYDDYNNVWTIINCHKPYPLEISGAVAFTIGDKGYVGTGINDNGHSISQFYKFDPVEADKPDGNPWLVETGMPSTYKRHNAVAFVIEDYGFVGTGEDETGTYYNDLWMFIPGDEVIQGVWVKRTNMPTDIGRTEAVGIAIEDQGYIGMGFDGTYNSSDFYRYDPYNDKWYECADYKVGATTPQAQTVRNACGFAIEDKGYVGTGYEGQEGDGQYSNEFWIYRPW